MPGAVNAGARAGAVATDSPRTIFEHKSQPWPAQSRRSGTRRGKIAGRGFTTRNRGTAQRCNWVADVAGRRARRAPSRLSDGNADSTWAGRSGPSPKETVKGQTAKAKADRPGSGVRAANPSELNRWPPGSPTSLRACGGGVDEFDERTRLQRSAPDQAAIDVLLRQQLGRVGRLH